MKKFVFCLNLFGIVAFFILGATVTGIKGIGGFFLYCSFVGNGVVDEAALKESGHDMLRQMKTFFAVNQIECYITVPVVLLCLLNVCIAFRDVWRSRRHEQLASTEEDGKTLTDQGKSTDTVKSKNIFFTLKRTALVLNVLGIFAFFPIGKILTDRQNRAFDDMLRGFVADGVMNEELLQTKFYDVPTMVEGFYGSVILLYILATLVALHCLLNVTVLYKDAWPKRWHKKQMYGDEKPPPFIPPYIKSNSIFDWKC